MLAYGYIKTNWQQAVDLYTRQCSIGVNAKDLATMAATLAAGGKNPVTGKQVMDAANVPSVLAVMSTAGLYDDSGKWLYHTGLPAKSGVGGGIIAVSPGKFGIAVVSPPLDDAGNSVRAQRAIADISDALGGNPYAAARQRSRPRRRRRASRSTGSRCSTSATTSNKSTPTGSTPCASPSCRSLRTSSVRTTTRSRVCGRAAWASGPRRRRHSANSRPSSSSSCSARAWTPDRPPSACAMRGESSASWGPVSTGARLPTLTCSRTRSNTGGPPGLPWFRNVQLRYTAIQTEKSNLMVALARPGASGDQGVYADRIELDGIRARFPLPDFAAAYKYTGKWGHVRTAGMLRRINWDDTLDDAFDLSGDATGWGWNVSSNLKPSENDVLRMQFTVGEGIQNEMNDSPVDIGIENNLSNPVTPIVGKPIPIVAISVFLDHTWNEKFSSAVGYSWQDNDNTDAQAPDAFKTGHYALGNLLYYPVPNVMVGGELQWGRRENFSDGFSSDGVQGAVLVQVQLLVEARRLAMTSIHECVLARRRGAARTGSARLVNAQAAGRRAAGGRRAPTRSSRTSRKARTPTTSRRWPRSIRISSASRS